MRIPLKYALAPIILFVAAVHTSDDPFGERLKTSANISPEIVDELKDFENLIPTAIVDAIVAEHLLIDGSFRKALKYLRGNEFSILQKQLLDMPEIITVLDFLHMTVNATMKSNTATAAAAAAAAVGTMDEAVRATAAASSSSTVNDNGIDKITTNTVTTVASDGTSTSAMATNNVLAYKRPQLDKLENTVDVSVVGYVGDPVEQQPLVDIVLLDGKLNPQHSYEPTKAVTVNDAHGNGDGAADHQHHHHHRHGHRYPLGSFTSFVEEIIGQLPQAAYQHMIIDKCKKNAKFADFYKALRSVEFRPLVDEAMKTSNIEKVISTLNAHDIDVKALEPIAFKVISWGPNV